MKKALSMAILIFLSACGSNDKIIGKWTHKINKDGLISVETCKYVENNTETCNEDLRLQTQIGLVEAKYIVTQEWQLKSGKLLEKNIDAKILSISVNGSNLLSTDEGYQRVSNIILALHPRGESFSRKIHFSGDKFNLTSDDGEISEFTRAN